jgi:hypothetical protein
MLSFVAHWGVVVALKRCIEIYIGEGVKKKIGLGPPSSVRLVVVVDCVEVEQFAGVIGAVSCLLQPYWKVIII